MKLDTAIVVAFSCVVPFAVVTLPSARAQAPVPPKGLFAEVATQVDGATVRRIRDREADVVCYVATGQTKAVYQGEWFPVGPTVAISCVRLFVVNP
jgi:hypothetical protein